MNSRTIHRWIGIAAAVLFLLVSITGFVLQIQQTFGKEEREREEQAQAVSSLTLANNFAPDLRVLNAARANLLRQFGPRSISGVDWQVSGTRPLYVLHLVGDPAVRVSVDARSGQLVERVSDEENWVLRLHSGEIFGEGGRFLGLAWGAGLITMTLTGIWLYVKMYRARRKGSAGRLSGLRRFFW